MIIISIEWLDKKGEFVGGLKPGVGWWLLLSAKRWQTRMEMCRTLIEGGRPFNRSPGQIWPRLKK